MNDPTLIGPCADYEHDLVDLHDGALAPERASSVRLHVEHCARCRAWAQDFAALDARLAADLPRPVLDANFDARLRERLAALSKPTVRGDLRTAIEVEHDSLVDTLRRGARRSALLGAVGSAAAMACVLVAARDLLADGSGALASVSGGLEHWMTFGAVGIAVAIAGLAWSATRNGLPMPGLAR
jgi:anti-sigma factor RsiW